MLDDQILLTSHLTLPLHILCHARRYKDILPTPIAMLVPALVALRVPLQILFPVHSVTDLNSRHCLMITIYIRQPDRRRMAQRRTEVVRATLRWHSRLSAAVVRRKEMWEEARDESFGRWHTGADYSSSHFDVRPDCRICIVPFASYVSSAYFNSIEKLTRQVV